MKKITIPFFIVLLLLTYKISAQNRDFYQIKTYLMNTPQQMEITENFLEDAYLPALKRNGIKAVGVFKPKTIESDSIKKIMVLIPFSSMDAFLNIDDKLQKDNAYLSAGANYLNATYTDAPYMRLESTLLKAFPNHPLLTPTPLNGPRKDRVYELRSYESATEAILKNKIDMFNVGGEIKLFDKLEFNAVFYAEVISGNKMPNLMYMTTFENKAKRDELWKAFFSSPEWKVLSAETKYKNNVSKAEIIFLTPTEYSDY
ncbi:NIPSNAP family protein [Flavobacteriaceae bacterium XHP0103]|uniref:NIPSNAP family protein n=1 Tax=Marixanthotalea marina TaxID=2844359 RepID=UPI002989DFFD|nr:NIPSNAP family protein [Marixanthotalea marina]MBU3821213.1 NIPSNAP family protein [Marixanthotalea marina]